MTTTTVHYTWQMPDPGGSANTWGATLNGTTQAIDNQVFLNQQGLAPVGSIMMFGGPLAPPNWLLCGGQSLSQVGTYAALYLAIGGYFTAPGAPAGTFNVPNLQAQFPIGAGTNLQGIFTNLGEVGGNLANALTVDNLPPHAHSITDVQHWHNLEQTAHGHGDPGHVHGIADPTHVHAAVIAPGGGHYLPAGTSGVVADINPTPSASTGITQTASAPAGIQPANANLVIDGAFTNLTGTNTAGAGAPFNVIPPFVCVNFIIRAF